MDIPDLFSSIKILVGNSVFEDATIIIKDNIIYIDFCADDLDGLEIDLNTVYDVWAGKRPKEGI